MLLIREVLQVMGLTMLFGLGSWLFHPKAPGWDTNPYAAYEKSLAAVAASDASILWVDARSSEAYKKGHIPSAIRLTEEEWDSLLGIILLEYWQPEQWVVVYCDNTGCQKSRKIAARLRQEVPGIQAYYLRGGWDTWRKR